MLRNGTCLAAALAITAPVMADSIDMSWRGRGAGETVLVTHDGRSMRTFAGDLRYEFSRGEGEAARFEGARTVLRQSLADGSARSLLARRPGPHRVELGYESSPLNQDQRTAIGAAMALGAEGASSAAVQLAVWEITHDFGDLDIRAGAFSVDADGALLGEVESVLARSGDSDIAASFAGFGGEQGLAVLTSDAGRQVAMVPLPAPLVIGGASLVLAAAASRRHRRS